MIKISLITICYNAESTLLPTLESVARQTYPHIEYIVVDGASRDNSLDLVRSICPEALITSEPDRGLYDAMNKGICRQQGTIFGSSMPGILCVGRLRCKKL